MGVVSPQQYIRRGCLGDLFGRRCFQDPAPKRIAPSFKSPIYDVGLYIPFSLLGRGSPISDVFQLRTLLVGRSINLLVCNREAARCLA